MSLKTIAEDTVQCNYFLTATNTDSVYLEELCDSVNKTIQKLSEGYIWHRDEFKVYVPLNKEKHDYSPKLVSTTCFGDNIEDEWLIVYLILEITKVYTNLIAQVQDNDGDFILIEAADFLPTWSNPDTTENRVFIYQNSIHIIPPTLVDIDSELNIIDAINIITSNQEETKSPEVHQAILNRIGNYPGKIAENIHRALVKLPIDVATLLTLKPSFVSPIASSYCDHDMLEARVCKNVTFKDCVTVPVKFTKCLYAMLTHSKLITNLKNVHVNLNDKKSVLGLKLTCGYEIIMSKLKGDVFSSIEYTKFIKSLCDNGYFRDNIEGSKEHTRLLENAKEFYLNMECPINSQLSNAIFQIMHTEEFSTLKETFLNTHQGLEKEFVEDNDDWLNIHPDELNNLLNTRYGKQPTFKNDDVMNSKIITSKLSDFLKEASDFEGIETGKKDEDNEIEFDSNIFINSLKNMLNIISGGDEIEADSDSNYDMDDVSPEDNIDEEIRTKLFSNIRSTSEDSQNIISNMIQSMKEEQGAPGPTSNLLKSIGINKANMLDSDDDEM